MDLKTKSDENIRIVEHCIELDAFRNAVASRVYYAVFQRMKHLLEIESYDYRAYLRRTGQEDGQRMYSHGTIQEAFSDHVGRTRGHLGYTKRAVVARLTDVDNLFSMRIAADYYGSADLQAGVLQKYYDKAVKVLSYIDEMESAKDRG